MTADGGEGDGKTRCLDAVRYTVAAVVTVLIIAVIVVAIKVVFRPESLSLSVVGGAVSSTPSLAADNAVVTLGVQLRAENPSGRARVYFINITAYLFDNKTVASSSTSGNDSFIFLKLADMVVAQQMGAAAWWNAEINDDPNVIDRFHFDMLYTKRQVISDLAMRVDGRLFTEVRSGINRTSQLVTYICWPLVVVGEVSGSGKDVPCTENLSGE